MSFNLFKVRTAAWTLALLCAITTLIASASVPGATHAASGCAAPRSDLAPDAEEAALIGKVNDYRAQAGLGTLAVSRSLMAAAAWKSNDLGVHNYFSHDDLDRSFSQRLQECGYAYPQIAENLAAGRPDAVSTYDLWRTSSEHNANLLDAYITAKVIGVARAHVPGSTYGWYWTADFGGVSDGSTGPTPPLPLNPATQTSLTIGSTATVSGISPDPGDCLKVHSEPAAAAPVVDCLTAGTSMIVSDGPVSADGYLWLQLGAVGWAVSDYLTPATP